MHENLSRRRAGAARHKRRPPAPLRAAPLIDKAVKRRDWVAMFEAIAKKAQQGSVTALHLMVQYRFGKPRQADTTDPRYLSYIEIIDPGESQSEAEGVQQVPRALPAPQTRKNGGGGGAQVKESAGRE